MTDNKQRMLENSIKNLRGLATTKSDSVTIRANGEDVVVSGEKLDGLKAGVAICLGVLGELTLEAELEGLKPEAEQENNDSSFWA